MTTSTTVLQGSDLRQAMLGAAAYMELYRDAANALNVFPVPDGDTGTNMLLTLRAGIDQMNKDADKDAAWEVAESIATGAFWGARGNSGVILSQLLRGFADGVAGSETIETSDAVAAFRSATDSAYGAVSQPREGTMLSVIRGASDATLRANDAGERDVVTLWQIAYDGAIEALALTPEQLPVLKEAGVVDSGGLGVVAIIGGALRHLQGDMGPAHDLGLRSMGNLIDPTQTASVSIDSDFLDTHERRASSATAPSSSSTARSSASTSSAPASTPSPTPRSSSVAGPPSASHVHTEDPGAALTFGVSYGDLDEVKIDNMSLQNRDWTTGHRERARPTEIRTGVSVVAVASGPRHRRPVPGRRLRRIVPGGQTLNPSASEIIDAALSVGTTDVIVLPNNSNVILTAGQAAEADTEGVRLHVVNTRSMPQGTAAMLGFNPEISVTDNLSSMDQAATSIETLEVTQAVRDSIVDGQSVSEGQFMAILDGSLVALAADADTAALDGLSHSSVDEDSIITLYWGEDADEEKATRLQESLESTYDGAEVDVYAGGQPHYPYLVSVE